MPVKLTKIWFAAMVALASLPALAADMPGSGTKNFIPGGDAPSYFTNENGAVSGVAAVDETPSDDGVDQNSRLAAIRDRADVFSQNDDAAARRASRAPSARKVQRGEFRR